MKPLAFVHNDAAPYRHGLFSRLAERQGVELLLYQGRSVAGRDVAEQASGLDVPWRLISQRQVYGEIDSGRYRGVIVSTNGRVALPAAFLAARHKRLPLVLWASMWRHPRTAAHSAGWPLVRRIYRGAEAVATYGPHVSRFVAEVRGSDEGIFEAPQATDNELLSAPGDPAVVRRIEDLTGGAPFVLFVGRTEKSKGVEVLRDAWRLLGGAQGARLVVLGTGPLLGELESVDGVLAAGAVPYPELPAWYSAAAATVLPSVPTRLFVEPWGFVCNESLLRETPVVASDAVGAVRGGLVEDGQTGLVVPAGDAQALSRAIRTLLTDPKLGEELGVRGRRRVLARHTHEAQVGGFERALEKAGISAHQ